MTNTLRVLLVTAICFLCFYVLMDFHFSQIRNIIDAGIHQTGISHILTYIFIGLPIFIGAGGLHSYKTTFSVLGLTGNVFKAMGYALLFTIPMFVGYAFFFKVNEALTFDKILIGAVAAAFFEELYFRGFLFGQLFRYTKLGFIPSVVVGALLFASGHLWQSQDVQTLFGIFITTFMGAVLFAWLYAEWNYNLYIAIGMHLFMNFSWMLFDVSDNALGNTYGNLFRYTSITIAIAFTVITKLRKGQPLAVNRNTLWKQESEVEIR